MIGVGGERVNGRGPGKEPRTSEFLYRIQATRLAMLTGGPTPEERQAVATHFAYLERFAAAGTVLLFGRTQTTDASTFGIVIFRAGSPGRPSASWRATRRCRPA